MRRILLSCSSIGLLFSSYFAAADELKVVTTVKPLSLIVQALTHDVTSSETLLPAGVSPHDYSLRPSDAKKLHDADLVIWVGPELEMFLTKILDGQANAFALTAQDGINFRHYEDDENEHDHDEHGHEHEHEHGGIDPHLWLGPDQAMQAAAVITKKLIAVDPDHQAQYQANLSHFISDVKATVVALKQQLTPLTKQGYFVFHDGYGYFEDQFKLNNLGHFTVEPDRRPGAKTLVSIRSSLKEAQAHCVFSEPQFSPSVVESVVRGTGVNIGTLDPMATDIEEGKNGYIQFIRQLAQQFSTCLKA